MRIPHSPPSIETVLQSFIGIPDGAARMWNICQAVGGPAPEGRYRHWDILRHLTPPEGLTLDEWWLGITLSRRMLLRDLPLRSIDGHPFRYMRTDAMDRMLYMIDQKAVDVIDETIHTSFILPRVRDRYMIQAMMEEAITSSQLEGASTTRKVAREMLWTGIPPDSRSELMIFNNYQAMIFLHQMRTQPLSRDIVFEIQRILTRGTLDNPDAVGRFRRDDELIQVVDHSDGTILHTPPPSGELMDRMDAMCSFANQTSDPFIHPVIRSILLHLWLAYDHPFVDGNGRTARALFYWSMGHHKYSLSEFVSISRILHKAPAQYERSFLYTETDGNDATYFILAQIQVVVQAINDLHTYVERKEKEAREHANKVISYLSQ